MDEANNIITTDNPVVNITIPLDSPGVATTQTSSTVSSDNLKDVDKSHIHKWNQIKDTNEYYCHCGEIAKVEEKPVDRNEKGQFVNGHQISVGNHGGNKCEYCERPEEILKKVMLYKEWCRGLVDGKQHQPYLQEMVSEDYLDITIDQLEDWIKSEDHKAEHAKLTRTVKKIMNRQQLNLLRMTLKPDTYRGARFQLSANHGMIVTEKQIQAGDKDNPIVKQIEIVGERKYVEQD